MTKFVVGTSARHRAGLGGWDVIIEHCEGNMRGGGRFLNWSRCKKMGKMQHEGKWYCGVHDPVKLAARRAAKSEKSHAEFIARLNAREKYNADIQAARDAVIDAAREWDTAWFYEDNVMDKLRRTVRALIKLEKENRT